MRLSGIFNALLLVIFISTQSLIAQTSLKDYQNKVDSLEKLLKKSNKTVQLEIYKNLSDAYLDMADFSETDPVLLYKKAIEISDSQLKLANELNDDFYTGISFFIKGQAYALISEYTGNVDTVNLSIDLFNKSIEYLSKTDSIDNLIQTYNKLIYAYQSNNELNKSIELCDKVLSLDISKIKKPKNLSDIYYLKGVSYAYQNEYPKSIETFVTLKEYATQQKDTISISRSLNSLGSIELFLGNYSKALEYLIESLKISEQQKNSKNESERQNAANEAAIRQVNIGNVLKELQRYDEALKYYNDALTYFQNRPNSEAKEFAAQCLNNIGTIHQINKKTDEAEAFYEEAAKIFIELKDSSNLMMSYINLGVIYSDKGELTRAKNSYQRALRIANATKDSRRIALITGNLGDVYRMNNQPLDAINYFKSSLAIAKEIGIKDLQKEAYDGLSKSYEMLDDPSKALQFYKLYSEVKDSLLNESNQRAVAQMKEQYESELKEQENQKLKSNNALLELQSKRDRLVKFGMGVILTMIIVFSIFVVIQLQEKKRKNILLAEQKEEIETQRDQILEQRDMLAKQKQEITDSIYYARRIQQAVLPSDEIIKDVLPEHFILFKPRDIVSGDFFWLAKRNNKSIVVAADCTGHGVPGAFMSMLGVAFLNEIVTSHKEITAGDVLNELRHYVKTTLGQTGKQDEAKDGMDIALCIIDWESQSMQYAGAYNPLYFFKDGVFNEIKANKMPIGVYIKDSEPFTNHTIEFQKGDTFYIFSDGYVSQFGGGDGRKFMTKPFKNLLESIQDKSMPEQLSILDQALLDWQGEFEQVDDISVIGFRF